MAGNEEKTDNRKPFTILYASTILATDQEQAERIAEAIAISENLNFQTENTVIMVSEGRPTI